MNSSQIIKTSLKIIGISFLILIITPLIWFNLPISLQYSDEIKAGNAFIKNIKAYQVEHNNLPFEKDWETFKRLGNSAQYEYEEQMPQYEITRNGHFTLTFVRGFDPPYLIYDSEIGKWEYKFPNKF